MIKIIIARIDIFITLASASWITLWLVLISVMVPVAALAQTTTPSAKTALKNATVSEVVEQQTPAQDFLKSQAFDELLDRGLTTKVPPQIETILGDNRGFRSRLAEYDIGFELSSTTIIAQDLTDSGQSDNPQRYSGQKFTLQQQAVVMTGVFGLNSLGLPNSKLVVSGLGLTTSFEPYGPDTVTLRGLSYYQSFLDKKIELNAGWTTNYMEFVGLFPAGSMVTSNGLSTLIPIQVGLSADPVPTPSANFTLNGANGFYTKLGFQRSVNPRGTLYEAKNNNSLGLEWSQDGAGLLTIGEVGVRRPAMPGSRYTWLRAGAIDNDSDYARFDGQGYSDNGALFAAGDLQLTQRNQSMPFRGFYVGASAFTAPSDVNVYTDTFELRAYDIGSLDSRPMDTTTVRLVYNKFGDPAQRAIEASGLYANESQFQAIVSYSARLSSGVYIIPTLTYTDNPSFIGDFNEAITASAVLYLSF